MRFQGGVEEISLNHEFHSWCWMPLGAVAVQVPFHDHALLLPEHAALADDVAPMRRCPS